MLHLHQQMAVMLHSRVQLRRKDYEAPVHILYMHACIRKTWSTSMTVYDSMHAGSHGYTHTSTNPMAHAQHRLDEDASDFLLHLTPLDGILVEEPR